LLLGRLIGEGLVCELLELETRIDDLGHYIRLTACVLLACERIA
jgi:hypothetical protein